MPREVSGNGLAACDHIDGLLADELPPFAALFALLAHPGVRRNFFRVIRRTSDAFADSLRVALDG